MPDSTKEIYPSIARRDLLVNWHITNLEIENLSSSGKIRFSIVSSMWMKLKTVSLCPAKKEKILEKNRQIPCSWCNKDRRRIQLHLSVCKWWDRSRDRDHYIRQKFHSRIAPHRQLPCFHMFVSDFPTEILKKKRKKSPYKFSFSIDV